MRDVNCEWVRFSVGGSGVYVGQNPALGIEWNFQHVQVSNYLRILMAILCVTNGVTIK